MIVHSLYVVQIYSAGNSKSHSDFFLLAQGTYPFLSRFILYDTVANKPHQHNIFDDLESFFFVGCVVVLLYCGHLPGYSPTSGAQKKYRIWNHADPSDAYTAKALDQYSIKMVMQVGHKSWQSVLPFLESFRANVLTPMGVPTDLTHDGLGKILAAQYDDLLQTLG